MYEQVRTTSSAVSRDGSYRSDSTQPDAWVIGRTVYWCRNLSGLKDIYVVVIPEKHNGDQAL